MTTHVALWLLTPGHAIDSRATGRTERGNMLPACSFCNGSKHKRNVLDWIEEKRIAVPILTLEFLAFHGHFDCEET